MRQQRGLTQAQVAERVGVATNYLSQIERGTKVPTLETLALIAAALGSTLTEILLGVDRPLPRRASSLDRRLSGQPPEVQRLILQMIDVALRLHERPPHR